MIVRRAGVRCVSCSQHVDETVWFAVLLSRTRSFEGLEVSVRGGFKAGHVHGSSDEFGYRPAEGPVSCQDLQAIVRPSDDADPSDPATTHLVRSGAAARDPA